MKNHDEDFPKTNAEDCNTSWYVQKPNMTVPLCLCGSLFLIQLTMGPELFSHVASCVEPDCANVGTLLHLNSSHRGVFEKGPIKFAAMPVLIVPAACSDERFRHW
jgi:hypothetical protein